MLDTAVTWIDDVERRSRALEGERLRAHAFLRAVAEAEAEGRQYGAASLESADTDISRPANAERAMPPAGGPVGPTGETRPLGAHRGPVERTLAFRSAVAEVAATALLTEQTVQHRIEKAAELVDAYPRTVSALAAGRIALQHAGVIAEAGRIIGTPGVHDTAEAAERREAYEALVLRYAEETSPNQLRPYARRIAERFAVQTIDDRYALEKTHRRVWVEAANDGMAYLSAYLAVDEAQAIYSRLTRMAKQTAAAEARETTDATRTSDVQDTAHSEMETETATESREAAPERRRTLDEIRTDLLADLLGLDFTDEASVATVGTAAETAGATPESVVRGIVQVIVHEKHLDANAAVADDEAVPAPELEGYGPIPLETARRIAGRARSWVEVTVNPGTGDIRKVTSRVPSAAQKRKLLVRDEHCRWPSCRAPGYRCDIDHTIAVVDGGATEMGNLGFLCRNHHTLKHHGGWHVAQHPSAVYEWTSPTGRKRFTRPASSVRFRAVEDPPAEERPDFGAVATATATVIDAAAIAEGAQPF